MKIYEITREIEKYAPVTLASDYDNVGLMVGDENREVKTVLLTLDVDLHVAMEAKALGAELIISHHPLIFNPLKNISADTPEGACLLFLIENKISVYSAHTNLDAASGGLNDLAAEFLSLQRTAPLEGTGEAGIGRIGSLPVPVCLYDLLGEMKRIYKVPFLRFVGSKDKMISKVALCTGSGGDLLGLAREKGADVYITGDIKYNVAREASAYGIGLIELGHYESEIIVVELLEKIITHFVKGNLSIYKSVANKNVFSFI